jgi:hypothetical protein
MTPFVAVAVLPPEPRVKFVLGQMVCVLLPVVLAPGELFTIIE